MPETIFPMPAKRHLLDGDIHRRVISEAAAAGLEIYVVGGYLRDLVLGDIGCLNFDGQTKPISKDLDYAVVGGGALAFAKKMASMLGGHFVTLDEKNDTGRVVMPDGIILDFAGCLGGSIQQDILRRDFTINSLYMDPANAGVIIDQVGGINDIKSGTIKALQSSLFVSDPLRLLRAFRFAAGLNFNIEAQTLAWIKSNANRISAVASERISAELFTILAVPSTNIIMPILAEAGLLEAIFPELKATRAVTNNSHHHLNLFDHSLETVIQCEQEYSPATDGGCAPNPPWLGTNLQEEISCAVTRMAACKIAGLLHDIGKPATWVITEEGKHTFIGHEKLGAEMIADIARRLRWSKPVERCITKLVHFHLRPGQLFHHNKPSEPAIHSHHKPSKAAINRLFRQSGDDLPALILLALGDLAATQGPLMIGEKSTFLRQSYYALLAEFYEFSAAAKVMEKLLDGEDVMRLLNLPPGKKIGKILMALREAQEIKKIVNRSEAEDFVRSLL
jgi:putative nucleotidyltransferase with HDIG domain